MLAPDRILVVRLGSLGDLIHTLPAVAALRRTYPDAEIDWLVDAPHRELLELVPAVSSVVALADRSVGAWLGARRALRRRRFDLAIDFQGLVKSAALARLSGARRVLGFARGDAREGAAAWFYSAAVPAEGGHVVEKNLRLAAAAGAVAGPVEFPIAPVASRALAEIRSRMPGRFALINPGAAWPNKRWPGDAFGRVARHVRERHGLHPVVLWGPGEEDLAARVVAASAGAAVAAPPTRLPDLVAIGRDATLMISGDTGPTHVVAAVGTPVVSLFGPTDPARNGPWPLDGRNVALSRYGDCGCHYQRRCRRGEAWCLPTIRVEDVQQAIDRVLAASAGTSGAIPVAG